MIQQLFVYQIIILLLAGFFILRTFLLFIFRKKSSRELVLAIFVWGFIGLVGVYPNITNYIAEATGFQLGINAVLVFSVMILSYIALRGLLKHDKMENSITRLIRQEALKDLKANIEKYR